MLGTVAIIFGCAIVAYVGLLFCVAWLSVHPKRVPIFLSPGVFGTPQEEVEVLNPNGTKLAGWWLENVPDADVAIFCHGYMMNRSEFAPVAAYLHRCGLACLLMDFPAHGKSGGSRTGLGWAEKDDVKAAVGWVRAKRPSAKVVLIGSSMGAAACALAVGDEPTLADALVLDSAYSRLTDAVQGWWRFLGGPALAFVLKPTILLSALLIDFNPWRVDVARALAFCQDVPVLIAHGDEDNLAVPKDAERNCSAHKGICRIVWFRGCGHSEGRLMEPQRYYAELLSFLQEHRFSLSQDLAFFNHSALKVV